MIAVFSTVSSNFPDVLFFFSSVLSFLPLSFPFLFSFYVALGKFILSIFPKSVWSSSISYTPDGHKLYVYQRCF